MHLLLVFSALFGLCATVIGQNEEAESVAVRAKWEPLLIDGPEAQKLIKAALPQLEVAIGAGNPLKLLKAFKAAKLVSAVTTFKLQMDVGIVHETDIAIKACELTLIRSDAFPKLSTETCDDRAYEIC